MNEYKIRTTIKQTISGDYPGEAMITIDLTIRATDLSEAFEEVHNLDLLGIINDIEITECTDVTDELL